MPHHKDGSDQTDDHIEQKRLKIIPGLHGDVGVDNAGNAGIVAPRAGVESAHEPGKHGVDRHAHEDNPQG